MSETLRNALRFVLAGLLVGLVPGCVTAGVVLGNADPGDALLPVMVGAALGLLLGLTAASGYLLLLLLRALIVGAHRDLRTIGRNLSGREETTAWHVVPPRSAVWDRELDG